MPKGDDVSVVKNFPPERIFNLVGTDSRDYTVAGGISSWAAGDASDGLVRIENATTAWCGSRRQGCEFPSRVCAPKPFGPLRYCEVEEGYQNLTRFLFGALRVDGILDIDDITLPVEVQKALDDGKTVRASYQFEIAASVRCQWQMTRREVRENSAIFRTYDDLFCGRLGTKRKPDRTKSPHLFSIFLDPNKSVKTSKSVSFAFDIKVLVPDYVVDGLLFMKRHYEGGFIYRELILVEAFPDETAPAGWRIKYGYQDMNPGKPGKEGRNPSPNQGEAMQVVALTDIPIEQNVRPGLVGTLRIEARPWA
ncbi:MAG: hypothetical protein R3B95_14100 [Nitrospirales bacterium]|nr:hypothetical protein [Nitrospirales bacterium]